MDDLDEVNEIEKTFIQVWGSQEQAYADLEALVSDFNRTIFDGKLPAVNIAIVTRWMLAGPLGGSRSAAPNYNPSSSGLPATIYRGHSAIGSKEGAAIIVAHEMIHHWEETITTEFEETSYPAEINGIIAQWYGDTVGGRIWRAAHSDRF